MSDTRTTGSLQRVAVFLVLAVGIILFLALKSTLTAPTGDSVPSSRTACERTQSTAHTAGRESWCD